jgi:hypothetical protein
MSSSQPPPKRTPPKRTIVTKPAIDDLRRRSAKDAKPRPGHGSANNPTPEQKKDSLFMANVKGD